MTRRQYILTMQCDDRPGIIAALSPLLSSQGCDIREAAVYGDKQTETFFVRMRLAANAGNRDTLAAAIKPLADDLSRTWSLFDADQKTRVLIAVSKFGHCLHDLLHKWQIGALPVEIVGVVSNHEDMRTVTEMAGLPYTCLPVSRDTKLAQEQAFRTLIDESRAELVVLARYMQVLSDEFCTWLSGRCINIHHSFLPSFKGARPYHQAHARGVKLIGATAHFVTADLDEGPIIEQDVRRVTHVTTPEDMVAIGREIESSVLSRSVKWYAEHRLFLNGTGTVALF